MKALAAFLLLFFQAGQDPEKWVCREGSQPLPKEELASVKLGKLKERVESCSLPRLPGGFCGQGTVLVELQVDENGSVQCARPLTNHDPVMRGAAVEAAMEWRFKPLVVDGKSRPYRSLLVIVVHWDGVEAAKQCPKEKRRA